MNVHYQAWGLVAKVPALQDRLYGFLREFHSQRAEILETIREGHRPAGPLPPASMPRRSPTASWRC